MIARLRGVLEGLDKDRAYVQAAGGLTYEVLLPSFAVGRMTGLVGQAVALHIHDYVEAPNQGSTMIPRLAGFLTAQDKQFFDLFTTCKGIGPRKALRAMALETGVIAAAIADRDLGLLQSLPEVGRRTAETIVMELREKVRPLVSAAAYGGREGGSEGADGQASRGAGAVGITRDALEVLLQLGENRLQAVGWIDQVMSAREAPRTAQELVSRVYQLKSRG